MIVINAFRSRNLTHRIADAPKEDIFAKYEGADNGFVDVPTVIAEPPKVRVDHTCLDILPIWQFESARRMLATLCFNIFW